LYFPTFIYIGKIQYIERGRLQMWEEIIAWICKWWIELLLGGLTTVFGCVARHYFKLAKESKKRE
jgi:hypothetical protein